ASEADAPATPAALQHGWRDGRHQAAVGGDQATGARGHPAPPRQPAWPARSTTGPAVQPAARWRPIGSAAGRRVWRVRRAGTTGTATGQPVGTAERPAVWATRPARTIHA